VSVDRTIAEAPRESKCKSKEIILLSLDLDDGHDTGEHYCDQVENNSRFRVDFVNDLAHNECPKHLTNAEQ